MKKDVPMVVKKGSKGDNNLYSCSFSRTARKPLWVSNRFSFCPTAIAFGACTVFGHLGMSVEVLVAISADPNWDAVVRLARDRPEYGLSFEYEL